MDHADATLGIWQRRGVPGDSSSSSLALSSRPDPQVKVRQSNTYAILELTLHEGSYSWRFVPEAGRTFTDTGTQDCHSGSGGGSPMHKHQRSELLACGARGWIRTDDLPMTRRMLGVDLEGSRRI
jgi:hypothetical protein